MLEITREHVVCSLSAAHAPAARCQSGETVLFHTRDCYNDEIQKETDSPAGEFANPATGPLFVEGAEPGDVLKVEVLRIETDATGVMRTAPSHGAYQHVIKERVAKVFPIENGEILFDEHLRIPVDTMIGVIGTAPAGGEDISTETPREHGGNMDCRRIRQGSVLYLPVSVPGALLSVGDLHALMGDGETGICGLETAGEVTVQVTVIKEAEKRKNPEEFRIFQAMRGALPLLAEGGQLMTIQSAETLDQAAFLAANRMRELAAAASGMDLVNSGMAMSLLGDLAVCQIVNPLKTVRCQFPLEVLARYGFCLD